MTIVRHARAVRGLRSTACALVPQQFFPASDRPELLVDLRLPQNASIYASETLASRLDALLKGDPDVDHWSTYVGPRRDPLLPAAQRRSLPNDFFAQAVIVAKGLEARERLRAQLEKVLADEFPSVVGRVYPLELGPPVGWPVQYRVSGPDVSTGARDRARGRRGDRLGTPERPDDQLRLDGAGAQLADPRRPGRGAPARPELAGAGAGAQRASCPARRSRRCATTSISSTSWSAPAAEQRISLATLRDPAGAAAERPHGAARASSPPSITGRSIRWSGGATGVPTLTVQADVAPGALPATVVRRWTPKIAELDASLPSGYRIDVGGTVEESAKSQASVDRRRAADAVADAHRADGPAAELPAAVPGAERGAAGADRRRRGAAAVRTSRSGFVAILGVLALIGMIARNSVILIDQIEAERGARAAIPGTPSSRPAVHRFRPILLTAAAAILGMIPIAPTVFWGPMAFAIMGGLAVATVLTLVFLPALYVAWFRIDPPAETDVSGQPHEAAPALKGAAAG